MIEGGFISTGGDGELMDWEPDPETSVETTLGSATAAMGGAGGAGFTTSEGGACSG